MEPPALHFLFLLTRKGVGKMKMPKAQDRSAVSRLSTGCFAVTGGCFAGKCGNHTGKVGLLKRMEETEEDVDPGPPLLGYPTMSAS